MSTMERERQRASGPSSDWVKEPPERQESREKLLAALERALVSTWTASQAGTETTRHLLWATTYTGLESARRWRDLYDAMLEQALWREPLATETGAGLERTFHELAEQWRAETVLMSFVQDMALHPAYQQIIGLGPDAVPLILGELQREPDHWFWALNAITREDPTGPEDAGDIEKMTKKWLKWGRERGYIIDDPGARKPLP